MLTLFRTLVVVGLASLAGWAVAQPIDPTAPDAVVEYGGPDPLVIETADGPVSFTVELAISPEARQRGMMHRETLAPDAGMLFDFEFDQRVTIWMENTLIPLDVIYIRSDGTIAKIIANAQPLSRRRLPSDVPVRSVLEIAGGRADALNIAPGDLVRHAWFGTVPSEETPDAAPMADAGANGDG